MDEKFRVATQFTAAQITEPNSPAKKIVCSVLYGYVKFLIQFCPYQPDAKRHLILNYFSKNFDPWYHENFPLLVPDRFLSTQLRSKTQGWFGINLKRMLKKAEKKREEEEDDGMQVEIFRPGVLSVMPVFSDTVDSRSNELQGTNQFNLS